MERSGAWVVDPVTQVELWVPDGLDPESAIVRAQRDRDGLLIPVQLMAEHGVSWPIWQRGVGLLAEHSLPLSADLNRDLRAWARFWESHVGLSGVWSSPDDHQWWLRQARQLEDALEVELWDVATIERSFADDEDGGGGGQSGSSAPIT